MNCKRLQKAGIGVTITEGSKSSAICAVVRISAGELYIAVKTNAGFQTVLHYSLPLLLRYYAKLHKSVF